MSNTFKVIDMVTKEALRVAHESASFIGTIDRQYDDSFKDNGKGKKGASLRVREPNQYTRRAGSRVMDVQDQAESDQTITVATQDGVDMRFNSAELMQSVNNGAAFDDLSKNYIEPAVKVLISNIEADVLAYCTKQTYNLVGTAGTAITTLDVPGKARAKLNQQLAPKDKQRAIQMDSVGMGALVNGMAAYFNPANVIGEQYREGLISRTGMADYYENERVWTMTTGSDHTTVTTDASAAVTDGGTNITISGGTVTVGSVFTVAGVYDCHPETKAAYPHLKQFVITAGTSGALTVSPATILTGAKKNVCSSSGATLATTDFNSQVVTLVGAASTSYVQPIMYHKEAFQFVTADLPLYDAQKCVRRVQDGLSMRVWMDSDIRNDELLMRIDILYGMKALRPQWACRMIGSANA
jgi:hypothetical protein